MHNLITDPLMTVALAGGERQSLSLPALFAHLMQDKVSGFPALRPHQAPAWHCFLAQLGALALHRAEKDTLPEDVESWMHLLRGLTPDFPNDEPWHLIVEDGAKPAFLQPPEPAGITYTGCAETPDALDMLIGQKNHDLKDNGLHSDAPEDWMFALVSKQTGDGFNGSGNYGIARMNGGSSSRLAMGVVPLSARSGVPTPGARLRHDIALLLETRSQQLEENEAIGYLPNGGLALLWLAPWPADEAEGLKLNGLDIWFIEICRRIRLTRTSGKITARTGTSKKERVAAKQFSGNIGDPWAPVDVSSSKTITFGEGTLDYKSISKWLFGSDFKLPILFRSARLDVHDGNWHLIVQVIGRGKSKTYGYHERLIILPKRIKKRTLTERDRLQKLSKELIEAVGALEKNLAHAIAIAASDGRSSGTRKEDFEHGKYWRDQLDDLADKSFFPTLWDMLEADLANNAGARDAAKHTYLRSLIKTARTFLDQATAATGNAMYHYRARARAAQRFEGGIRKDFPWFHDKKETDDAAA